jgi:hypothetical protein
MASINYPNLLHPDKTHGVNNTGDVFFPFEAKWCHIGVNLASTIFRLSQ